MKTLQTQCFLLILPKIIRFSSLTTVPMADSGIKIFGFALLFLRGLFCKIIYRWVLLIPTAKNVNYVGLTFCHLLVSFRYKS